MVQTINLGGKDRAILFGFRTFKRIQVEFGVSLADVQKALSEGDLNSIPELAFCALKCADEKNKTISEPYTLEDVCDWLDETGKASAVIMFLADSLIAMSGGEPDPETSAKKKK